MKKTSSLEEERAPHAWTGNPPKISWAGECPLLDFWTTFPFDFHFMMFLCWRELMGYIYFESRKLKNNWWNSSSQHSYQQLCSWQGKALSIQLMEIQDLQLIKSMTLKIVFLGPCLSLIAMKRAWKVEWLERRMENLGIDQQKSLTTILFYRRGTGEDEW